jgi:hypothetical protein
MARRTPHVPRNATPTSPALVALAWLMVGLPLTYGVYQTLLKASKLFTG